MDHPDTIPDDEQLAAAERNTVYLRLAWRSPTTAEKARLGGLAFLDALQRLHETIDLSLRIGTLGGTAHVALAVRGLDRDNALEAAAQVLVLLDGCLPYYGWEIADQPVGDWFAAIEPDPDQIRWASRTVRGSLDDSGVRAAEASPLGQALRAHDATVSLGLALRAGDDGGIDLAADVVVVSPSTSTAPLAALVATEARGDISLDLDHSHGSDARRYWDDHRRGAAPTVPAVALADILSFGVRATGPVGWKPVPARPATSATLMTELRVAPEQHRLLTGRTGTGKSTLLSGLIAADADDGKTIVVIDPHGDLAHELAESLAVGHRSRLEVLDFGTRTPPPWNLLTSEPGVTASAATNEVCELMRGVWDDMPADYFGPVFWRIFRWAVDVVMRFGPARDLTEVFRVMGGDEAFLASIVPKRETAVWSEWEREFSGTIGKAGNDHVLWARSKLDPFLSDDHLREIFCADDVALSIADAVATNRILIVRAPVGVLGLMATRVLCTTIVSRLSSCLGRRFEDDRERPPVALYIDEWQRVAQDLVLRLLAEGRKQGFEISLANQSLRQVRDPGHLLGTVGTVAAFRSGPAETTLLSHEFASLDEGALRRLPPYMVAVRTPTRELVAVTPPPTPRRHHRPTPSLFDREKPASPARPSPRPVAP